MKTEEAFYKVKDGRTAYVCEKVNAYTFIPFLFTPEEICDLREMVFYAENNNGIILKKHSPFRERIATIWFWMRETGIDKKYRDFWAIRKPPCMLKSLFIKVGLDYSGSLLLFLLVSYIISLLILLLERIYSHSSKFIVEDN